MCLDHFETPPSTSLAINMAAGGFAGITEHSVMYPLDCVKTRMQSLSSATGTYNISTTFMNMIRNEGFFRPIRGVTAMIAGAGPSHALYFGSYELSKEFLSNFTPHNNVNYMASGVIATIIHAAVANPTEVIKQRMQMYNSPYKSVIACMKGVYKTEGAKAFYRSYTTQLAMNIPHQSIHLMTYEFLQNLLNPNRKYSPVLHVIAGGTAGACAAAVSTPLDVIKTLLNTQEKGSTRGMFHAMKRIYVMAGPTGFFKGITARVLYSMPATAICWSTYEFFKFYLTGLSHEHYKSSVSGKSLLQPKGEASVMQTAKQMSMSVNTESDNDVKFVLKPPTADEVTPSAVPKGLS